MIIFVFSFLFSRAYFSRKFYGKYGFQVFRENPKLEDFHENIFVASLIRTTLLTNDQTLVGPLSGWVGWVGWMGGGFTTQFQEQFKRSQLILLYNTHFLGKLLKC